MAEKRPPTPVLVLGIGNILMGDEGVGVHVVNRLNQMNLPNVHIVDGGTGSFHLLGDLQSHRQVVLIDATIDGQPAGTVTLLHPKFSSDYPPTLTAHDIGLKDLLDALYLSGSAPEVTLFAISINPLNNLSLNLSEELQKSLDNIVQRIAEYIKKISGNP